MAVDKPKKIVIGYARVSSSEQADSGNSLEVQAARIRDHAAAKGLGEVELLVDAGESAKSLKRPAMLDLLARVQRGEVSHIVATKQDRISRSVRDMYAIIDLVTKHDVVVMMTDERYDTSTADERVMVGLRTLLSQRERELTGERTKRVLGHMKKQGLQAGNIPFGWMRGEVAKVRPDGRTTYKLVECPREQEILQFIIDRRERGKSFTVIANALNCSGLRSRIGGMWAKQYVRNLWLSVQAQRRPDCTGPRVVD